MPFHTTLARPADAFHGVPERTWRLYPFYMLGIVLIGFGVLALLPDASLRFYGGWVWIFDWPGRRVYAWSAIVLGAAHTTSVFMAWRLRYLTMITLCPVFVAIALNITRIGGNIGPGVLVYSSMALLGFWVLWFRGRIE